MTREHKLALIVGFSLVLIVGVLISDHFSRARTAKVGGDVTEGTPQKFGSATHGLDAPGGRRSGGVTELASHTATPPPSLPGQLSDPEGRAAAGSPSRTQPPEFVMGERVGHAGPAPSTVPVGAGESSPAANQGVPAGLREHFVQVPENSPSATGATALRPDNSLPTGPRPLVGTDLTRDPAQPPVVALPPAGPAKPVSTGAVARHTVSEGESIYRISANQYGDGTLWTKLRAHNPGKIGADGEVREGVTLLLPPKDVLLGRAILPDPTRKAGQPAAPSPLMPRPGSSQTVSATYTVQRGDILSEVAKRLLGSSTRMREIVALNGDVLEDPDTLQAGMTLKIPTR